MSESLVTNLSKSALLIILDSTGHSPSAHRAAQPQTAFPHSRYRSRFRIRRTTHLVLLAGKIDNPNCLQAFGIFSFRDNTDLNARSKRSVGTVMRIHEGREFAQACPGGGSSNARLRQTVWQCGRRRGRMGIDRKSTRL